MDELMTYLNSTNMYTNKLQFLCLSYNGQISNLTTPVNHQNYLNYFRPWTVGFVRVLIAFIRDVLYCLPRDVIPMKIAVFRVKVVVAIEWY